MEQLALILTAFLASWLTFFSGFGLGTILTPVFYFVFRDITSAVAATAIVHFLNNVFKFALMKKRIDWSIAIPFGVASIPAAFLGAFMLSYFDDKMLFSYSLGFGEFDVYSMNLVFGILLIVFSLMEMIPKLNFDFNVKGLWVGGLISGFFGGLSGHQGALRTAFLKRYKLDKEVFIATGIVIALAVDIARSSVYFSSFEKGNLSENWQLILFTLLAALGGAITGKYFLKKMNSEVLNAIIGMAMLIFGIALAMGLLNTK